MSSTIYSIGYGNRRIDEFIDLVKLYRIQAVCDVRSTPFSSRYPDFGRDALRRTLRMAGVKYVFLGDQLGARPSDPELYEDRRASYHAMSKSSPFHHGLERLEQGAERFSV